MTPTASSQTESTGTKALVYGLSVVVLGLVAFLIYGIEPSAAGAAPSGWASANAAFNMAATVFLLLGFRFIKRGEIEAHRKSMLAAFAMSTLFLLGYVINHAQVGSVPFTGTGALRTVYYALLIPHIVLAAIVLPMALFTLYRGWTQRIEQHRKIAKITLPIWLYVSISGVVLYFLLYHL